MGIAKSKNNNPPKKKGDEDRKKRKYHFVLSNECIQASHAPRTKPNPNQQKGERRENREK